MGKTYLRIIVLILSVLFPFNILASDSSLEEYQLKAALLFKISNFIIWPETDEEKNSKDFTICILGENVFGEILNTLNGKASNGKKIAFKFYEQSRSINSLCQIVFISESKKSSLSDILNNLKNLPILTIGDFEKFAENGGMIHFMSDNGKITININLDSATSAGLKISAPLLQLSNIKATK